MKSAILLFVFLALIGLPLRAGEPVVWQHSTSATVQLSIRDKEGALGSYQAVFTVRMPDKSSVSKTIKVAHSDTGYVTFPDSFEHVSAQDGHYTWSATVDGKEVVAGAFDFFTNQAGQQGACQRGVSTKFSDS